MSVSRTAAALALAFALTAQAQTQTAPAAGTLVIVPASGEVTLPNDQAVVTLAIEEQDKDKAAAASRVNQKMANGMEIVRRQDPQAKLKTQGYYTYPVYPDERPLPSGAVPKPRVPTAWRIGQYLEVTTSNLAGLPKTVAAAQAVLTLNNLHFGLSRAAIRKLDDQRIAATYRNLGERIAAIAAAMGRQPSDAVLETLDFEGSGAYAPMPPMEMRSVAATGMRKQADEVAEPSFEAGETTLEMKAVGRLRFK